MTMARDTSEALRAATTGQHDAHGAAMSSNSEKVARYLEVTQKLVTAWIKEGENDRTPVAKWSNSKSLRENVRLRVHEGDGVGDEALFEAMSEVLDNSVNPWTGRFLDKLYAAPQPLGVAAETLLAAINANAHVMSASPMLCLAEECCVSAFARLCGWDEARSDGLTMPGGSSSNNLAVQTALSTLFPSFHADGVLGIGQELANRGLQGRSAAACRPLIFTSEQSHYSLDKAAIACGLGLSSVVKVACDDRGRMDPKELELHLSAAFSKENTASTPQGFPFFVNATSGSTVMGSFDQLAEIAAVCRKQPHPVWLHVDASWGGPVLFSQSARKLMSGIEAADSMAINPHKLLNIPLQCSFALFRNGNALDNNALDAPYLFHGRDSTSKEQKDAERKLARRENPALMAYGCGRRGDALKMYLAWLSTGTTGFARHVERGMSLAREVINLIRTPAYASRLELGPASASDKDDDGPAFLQVCFRPALPQGQSFKGEEQERSEILSKATRHVYETLKMRKRFAVDFAPLPRGIGDFIRLVTHPSTTVENLRDLVEQVAVIGEEYLSREG